jgi:hypothetical protein
MLGEEKDYLAGEDELDRLGGWGPHGPPSTV